MLKSHRGWDPGSLTLAARLAETLGAPFHAQTVTRLLIDANRSLHHRGLFSEFTRALDSSEKKALIESVWRPHRERVERSLGEDGVYRFRSIDPSLKRRMHPQDHEAPTDGPMMV